MSLEQKEWSLEGLIIKQGVDQVDKVTKEIQFFLLVWKMT